MPLQTTLDAMIMDGNTMEVGAVSSLRHVGHAVSTARLVMERTRHSMLAGLQVRNRSFSRQQVMRAYPVVPPSMAVCLSEQLCLHVPVSTHLHVCAIKASTSIGVLATENGEAYHQVGAAELH